MEKNDIFDLVNNNDYSFNFRDIEENPAPLDCSSASNEDIIHFRKRGCPVCQLKDTFRPRMVYEVHEGVSFPAMQIWCIACGLAGPFCLDRDRACAAFCLILDAIWLVREGKHTGQRVRDVLGLDGGAA